MFSEKLNFLMDITKVQNNLLASAANVDASHISRLRHGNRNLPKKQTFLMPMARFFARKIVVEYQKKIISDAIGIHGEWPSDSAKAAKLIYDWLSDTADETSSVNAIIQGFSSSYRKAADFTPISPDLSHDVQKYYYGISGKREAVIRFLSTVLNENTPQTLLLFSDEEMSWRYEDAVFSKKWGTLLLSVLKKGNRIKIIHTVNRNLNELMQAVAKWIPIYACGAIEPYCYPRLRDGLFQRTLFIAPNNVAVVSNSVAQQTDNMLNLYIDDKDAVAALAEDFNNYLRICKPLMEIYNLQNAEKFKKKYFDFADADNDVISLRGSLSVSTMPQSLIDEIDIPVLSEFYKSCKARFFYTVEHFSYTHLLSSSLLKEEDVSAQPPGLPDIRLTKSQHLQHIKNIIRLLKAYQNYNVALHDGIAPNIIISAKESVGVMMCKTQSPYCAFAFDEPNMTAAFWDYLSHVKSMADNKNIIISKLEKLI